MAKHLPPFLTCDQCLNEFFTSPGETPAGDEAGDEASVGGCHGFSWFGPDAETRSAGMTLDEARVVAPLLPQFHSRALDKKLCQKCKAIAHQRRQAACLRAQANDHQHYFAGELQLLLLESITRHTDVGVRVRVDNGTCLCMTLCKQVGASNINFLYSRACSTAWVPTEVGNWHNYVACVIICHLCCACNKARCCCFAMELRGGHHLPPSRLHPFLTQLPARSFIRNQ